MNPERPGGQSLLAFADLVLDWSAHTATRGRREMHLTRTEIQLLDAFLRHPRRVLSAGQLLAAVWGTDVGESNQVAVHVYNLRRKLEAQGGSRLIHTVRGAGYVLREAL